jgi:gluconolactonase
MQRSLEGFASMLKFTVIIAMTIGWTVNAYSQQLLIKGDRQIMINGETLETLWEEGGFTEGAAAGPDGNMYFSDFAQPFESGPARVMMYSPNSGKTSVFCPDSGMGNGLMFTRAGDLMGCCASPLKGHRALVHFLPDGKVKIVANSFNGKKLNSPNDIVITKDGTIYFTDPKYVGPEERELDRYYVFKYSTTGELSIATNQIDKPNGIILSPDQKTVYVAETDNGSDKADIEKDFKMGRMTLNSFTIRRSGQWTNKKVLVDFGDQLGIDGMTVDTAGNIYAAVRSAERFGIVIFSSKGTELGYIETPELPTNVSFGRGAESSRLYITAGKGFYRIRTKAIGYHPAIAD